MIRVDAGTPERFFIDSIRSATASVLSQALSSAWSVEWSADSDTAEKITGPCFELTVQGPVTGKAVIQLPTAGALLLSQSFLGEPSDSSAELTPDRAEALEELLRQITGSATTILRSKFGDVETKLARTDACGYEEPTSRVTASNSSHSQFSIDVYLTPELLASLAPASDGLDKKTRQHAENVPVQQHELKVNRLAGVKLKLSLRFGETYLTLRQLMQLSPGAVVELDRRLHQPVDLLLGDRVVAQGDVVVIEGSYGLRVTDLPLRIFEAPAAVSQ